MHYIKLTVGDTLIEFHNNWLGQETIIVNGQVVSQKSSVMGIDHHFSVSENGHAANYILTTKLVNGLTVAIDLRRNGELLHENKVVPYGNKPRRPQNKYKQSGIKHLMGYDVRGALADFERALDFTPKDPEIYFYMACAHSLLEDVTGGYESLRQSVAHGLHDTEQILNHEMLAFLRMQDAFEAFFASNYTACDLSDPERDEIE